jgi:Domain of unknown function (DUF929)
MQAEVTVGQESKTRAAARAKAAQMRAAERRREQRQRMLIAGGLFVGVLVIIAVIVGLKASGLGSNKKPTVAASPAQSADPAILKDITSVPATTLDSVGAGTAAGFPKKITIPAPPASTGKPEILYVGAEYCPFCAAERWGLAVALSRFGTLTGVGVTHSSSTDTYPNTPTLTFHGSTLTSSYITFVPYETTTNQPQGNGYTPLDTPSATDQKLFDSYDGPPYLSTADAGSIPFIYFGGKYMSSGASYAPSLLAGKTQAEVAAVLADPSNKIAKAVDGSANIITAAICAATNQQPASVCTAAGTKAGAGKLGGS